MENRGKCPVCGESLQKDAFFCMQCGTAIDIPASSRQTVEAVFPETKSANLVSKDEKPPVSASVPMSVTPQREPSELQMEEMDSYEPQQDKIVGLRLSKVGDLGGLENPFMSKKGGGLQSILHPNVKPFVPSPTRKIRFRESIASDKLEQAESSGFEPTNQPTAEELDVEGVIQEPLVFSKAASPSEPQTSIVRSVEKPEALKETPSTIPEARVRELAENPNLGLVEEEYDPKVKPESAEPFESPPEETKKLEQFSNESQTEEPTVTANPERVEAIAEEIINLVHEPVDENSEQERASEPAEQFESSPEETKGLEQLEAIAGENINLAHEPVDENSEQERASEPAEQFESSPEETKKLEQLSIATPTAEPMVTPELERVAAIAGEEINLVHESVEENSEQEITSEPASRFECPPEEPKELEMISVETPTEEFAAIPEPERVEAIAREEIKLAHELVEENFQQEITPESAELFKIPPEEIKELEQYPVEIPTEEPEVVPEPAQVEVLLTPQMNLEPEPEEVFVDPEPMPKSAELFMHLEEEPEPVDISNREQTNSATRPEAAVTSESGVAQKRMVDHIRQQVEAMYQGNAQMPDTPRSADFPSQPMSPQNRIITDPIWDGFGSPSVKKLSKPKPTRFGKPNSDTKDYSRRK